MSFFRRHTDVVSTMEEFTTRYEQGIYITPWVVYVGNNNEGYVRIIKDGDILFTDDDNIVKVGGLYVTQVDDYMMYVTEENISDLNVYLNDSIVGKINDKYTTIYLGDNSSLFTGDGYNFRYGVYDESIQSELNEKGWFYDVRFEGIRSNPNIDDNSNTEIEINLNNALNGLIPVEYGMYNTSTQINNSYGYFKDSKNNILLKNTSIGYNMNYDININDNKLLIGFYSSVTKTGINGIILNEIGTSIYSDPILNPINTLSIENDMKIKNLTVNLLASHEIPNSVYITVTDNKAHTYRKLWENQPISFLLPDGYDFVVYASNFITENGKEYFISNKTLVEDEIIYLSYETKSGIEIKNNILGYYTNETDWYVSLENLTGEWGEVDVPEVSVSEILFSDSDGMLNTEIISKTNTNSIFEKSIKFDKFENGIKGYIPSYIELEIFSQYLPEINSFLLNKGKTPLNFEKVWVSESFDEKNAWCSDGNVYPKTNILNYYIFGRKITF